MSQVLSTKYLLDALAAIKSQVLDTAVPAHCHIHLAKPPFTPNPTSDPASFTEADYTGYAAVTITAWDNPALTPADLAEIVGTTVAQFRPTGTTVTNSIAGFWVLDAAGDFVFAQVFSTPVALTGPNTVLSIVPRWQQAPSAWLFDVIG